MVKRRRGKKSIPPQVSKQIYLSPLQASAELLEEGTVESIRDAKHRVSELLKYNWEYYSELAYQRNQILEEIKQALIQTCLSDYEFRKWQRAVKYKYGLHPLSTVGSLTYTGGRFNTGEDVNSQVPSFPALYLASDKDTALQETLGLRFDIRSALTPRELALMNPQSEVLVSVSGKLEKVFDLRSPKTLQPFFELIKGFKFSEKLILKAKRLNIDPPAIVQSSSHLLKTLLTTDWQAIPADGEIPANSQIFGHLIYQAGIEGILYPSRLTRKKCLTIFPHNFEASSSYLVLDDEPPHIKVCKRVDSSNWRDCDLSPKELIEGV